MPRVIRCAVISLLVFPTIAAAQAALPLAQGDTVRFSTAIPTGRWVEPYWQVRVVERPARDTLVVRPLGSAGASQALPVESLWLLEVSRGREPTGNNAGAYAAGGALAGVLAYGLADIARGRQIRGSHAIVVSGAIGAVISYVWGRSRPGAHLWQEVRLPPRPTAQDSTATRPD